MTELDQNKLRRLDLTILLIFLGVMRRGKASDVATDLGLTAPSISHALGRLRDIFEDPLFLRRPHGLEPTAFAREIEPDVRRAVEALQAALSGPDLFDPTTARAHIRLSARDSEIAATLPGVLSRIYARAPHLTLSVQALTSPGAVRGLRDGSIDLAIGYFSQIPDDVECRLLRTETYLVVARTGHPILTGPLTLERYLAAAHVLVSTDTTMRGIVDIKLAESGLTRHVALSLPQFLPTLAVLAQSDLVAMLPARIAEENAARFGLEVRQPPLDIRSFDLSALRHRRDLRNQAVGWCMAQIMESP